MGFFPGGGSGGGGGGGGGDVSTIPILATDPVSPVSGDAWVLQTDFVEPTSVTDDGNWFTDGSPAGGAIEFSIPMIQPGEFVDLFGSDATIDASLKVLLSQDDGVSVSQASLATDGTAGLKVTYGEMSTINDIIAALNVFSQAAITKNVATLNGSYTGTELVTDPSFGSPTQFNITSDHTPQSAVLKIRGDGGATYSVAMTTGM